MRCSRKKLDNKNYKLEDNTRYKNHKSQNQTRLATANDRRRLFGMEAKTTSEYSLTVLAAYIGIKLLKSTQNREAIIIGDSELTIKAVEMACQFNKPKLIGMPLLASRTSNKHSHRKHSMEMHLFCFESTTLWNCYRNILFILFGIFFH